MREVNFRSAFAMSKYEITFEDYDRYLKARSRDSGDRGHDNGWGRGRRPAINVTRSDAIAYTEWLSSQTDAPYRLPSEAEWEYAAKAGTETAWPWGDEFEPRRANCRDCGSRWDGELTAPVGSFAPNPWGLHDMYGNVFEIVLDCWQPNHKDAHRDGRARLSGAGEKEPRGSGNCKKIHIRGGAWTTRFPITRGVDRTHAPSRIYSAFIGFRVVRELPDGFSEDARGTPGAGSARGAASSCREPAST